MRRDRSVKSAEHKTSITVAAKVLPAATLIVTSRSRRHTPKLKIATVYVFSSRFVR